MISTLITEKKKDADESFPIGKGESCVDGSTWETARQHQQCSKVQVLQRLNYHNAPPKQLSTSNYSASQRPPLLVACLTMRTVLRCHSSYPSVARFWAGWTGSIRPTTTLGRRMRPASCLAPQPEPCRGRVWAEAWQRQRRIIWYIVRTHRAAALVTARVIASSSTCRLQCVDKIACLPAHFLKSSV